MPCVQNSGRQFSTSSATQNSSNPSQLSLTLPSQSDMEAVSACNFEAPKLHSTKALFRRLHVEPDEESVTRRSAHNLTNSMAVDKKNRTVADEVHLDIIPLIEALLKGGRFSVA